METTDVIICGCGPTGALLAAFLVQYGVKSILLEKELEITQDPRGIALDEDGIRLLQAVGIYDKIWTEIGQKMGYFNFINSAKSLHVPPFLRFNYNTIEGGTGHPGFICHKQPVLEKSLRNVIDQSTCSQIRSGSTVQAISEDEDYVYVTYMNKDGETKKLKSRYYVGADGKTGFTRKRYLEPKGITMEKDDKFKYEEAWVALNWKITPPTPKTHPHFPLWNLGYSPEDVYNAFFPYNFRFICNPERPSVCGRFGLHADRLWRFEFVVKRSEDGYEMAKYENVKKVVYPYLTHPGKKYNLNQEVAFPEDCIEVVRSRPFTFSARSCNKWSLGRVILCGDSAHVFPPFGGQGIASGFRDAASIAWRLKIATAPNFTAHEKLFSAWYMERKQQLEKSLAATIVNGNFCNERSAVKTFIRNWYLWFLQLVPSWRHWLELGQRQEGMTKYVWSPGMPFLPALGGGRSFPQVFCERYHAVQPTKPLFTDDVIFAPGRKQALFQLVVLLDSGREISAAMQDLAQLRDEFEGDLSVDEATYLVSETLRDAQLSAAAAKLDLENADAEIFRVVFAEEYDVRTCPERPEPTGYDGGRLRKEVKARYVVVRPDRFVFAACNTAMELVDVSKELRRVIQGIN